MLRTCKGGEVNWKFWNSKPRDVIPNPRDKRKKQDYSESVQRNILRVLQFYVFVLAFLILAAVSQ